MTLQAAPETRPLGRADRREVYELLDADPASNVFVSARVEAMGIESLSRSDELWGFWAGGRLTSLCYAGANMVPVNATEPALRSFAARARGQRRRSSSIVGPSEAVLRLGELVRPLWGLPRDTRPRQPLMVTDRTGPVRPDPAVRPVRPDEVSVLMPAAVAMFIEEVGVDPRAHGAEPIYHARVNELVQAGRTYARIEDGRVVFKAEVGAVSRHACQVQGVWLEPRLRGSGLATPAMAAVVELALRDHADVVTLYVNDYNRPARALYRRVGFWEVGTFATLRY